MSIGRPQTCKQCGAPRNPGYSEYLCTRCYQRKYNTYGSVGKSAHTDVRVLQAAAVLFDELGECPTYSQIAARANIRVSGVHESLVRLRAAGLVTFKDKNRYTLRITGLIYEAEITP